MIVELRRKGRTPDGVLGHLAACHDRIRRFSELAVRVSESPDAPAGDVAGAAWAVYRYFTVALPLHVADEDLSLAPRLRERCPEAAMALETMTAEHVAIDELLAELAPLWADAAAMRAGAAELARALDSVQCLEALLDRHLALEESAIYPSLGDLRAGTAAAILAEMKGRRRSRC